MISAICIASGLLTLSKEGVIMFHASGVYQCQFDFLCRWREADVQGKLDSYEGNGGFPKVDRNRVPTRNFGLIHRAVPECWRCGLWDWSHEATTSFLQYSEQKSTKLTDGNWDSVEVHSSFTHDVPLVSLSVIFIRWRKFYCFARKRRRYWNTFLNLPTGLCKCFMDSRANALRLSWQRTMFRCFLIEQ